MKTHGKLKVQVVSPGAGRNRGAPWSFCDKAHFVNFRTRGELQQQIHTCFNLDKSVMADLVTTPFVVFFSIFLRWCISLGPYSGFRKSPMYGDFEAQRHWMEITYHLPIQEWYQNSSNNDLLYWGLDYPPLTAYHSWICGYIANLIDPSWVALHTSRGHESPTHKLFMRTTVLVADVLLYFTAVIFYFKSLKRLDKRTKVLSSLVVLMQPGLMLIDHGHFQYNCISLGLTVWAVVGLCQGHDLLGSIAFVLALNYKQMELYHALPFFCYLLGSCFNGHENAIFKLVKLGITVVGTFLACWFPFLGSKESAFQVLHRIFPVARGIYEDKVASVWCGISPFIKLKTMFPPEQLMLLCLGTTLIALLVPSIHLLLRPTIGHFKVALINSSLVFFLFSFHVHEKSILLAVLAACLILPERPFECIWFIIISTFSMTPLLVKDGLLLQLIASSILWLVVSWVSFCPKHQPSNRYLEANWPHSPVFHALFILSLMGCAALTVGHVALRPPPKYPDLFPLLIAVFSCLHFVGFLIFFHWLQFHGIASHGYQKARVTKKKKL